MISPRHAHRCLLLPLACLAWIAAAWSGALAASNSSGAVEAPEPGTTIPARPPTDEELYEELRERVLVSTRYKESRLKSVMSRVRRAVNDDADDRDDALRRLRRSYREEIGFLARRFRAVRADFAQFHDKLAAMLINGMCTDYAAGFDNLARGSIRRSASLFRRAEENRLKAEDRLASAAAP